MPDDRKYCVYRHTSPNGKVYVGITCQNPLRRWSNGFGYKGNRYFMAAIVKYGWDNFNHEILFSDLTKAEACEKEEELIGFHRSTDREFGYNHSSGGEHPGTGCCPSAETRRKMSDAKKGVRFSEDHRRKISESKRGKYVVVQLTFDDQIVATYPTTGLAAEKVGCSQCYISMACCGSKKAAKGYKWKYEQI